MSYFKSTYLPYIKHNHYYSELTLHICIVVLPYSKIAKQKAETNNEGIDQTNFCPGRHLFKYVRNNDQEMTMCINFNINIRSSKLTGPKTLIYHDFTFTINIGSFSIWNWPSAMYFSRKKLHMRDVDFG